MLRRVEEVARQSIAEQVDAVLKGKEKTNGCAIKRKQRAPTPAPPS